MGKDHLQIMKNFSKDQSVTLGDKNYTTGMTCLYEPLHEKTCLCHMRTTKAQISLRIHAV